MAGDSGVSVSGVLTGSLAGVNDGAVTGVALTTGTVVIIVVGTAVGKTLAAGTAATGAVACAGVPSVMLTSWPGAAGFRATTENDCAAVSCDVRNVTMPIPLESVVT